MGHNCVPIEFFTIFALFPFLSLSHSSFSTLFGFPTFLTFFSILILSRFSRIPLLINFFPLILVSRTPMQTCVPRSIPTSANTIKNERILKNWTRFMWRNKLQSIHRMTESQLPCTSPGGLMHLLHIWCTMLRAKRSACFL